MHAFSKNLFFLGLLINQLFVSANHQRCRKLFRAAGANRAKGASRVAGANIAKGVFCHFIFFFWLILAQLNIKKLEPGPHLKRTVGAFTDVEALW